MTAPLYADAGRPAKLSDGHRGLWYDRFFDRYAADWTLADTDKKAWIDGVVGKVGDATQIQASVQRIAGLCTLLKGETRVYAADWHFATGLGNPHPVENGFLWHPTLGTPYLPGSAVKGLVRAWVEAWMEFDTEQQRRDTLYRWFGSEDKDFRQRKALRLEGYRPPTQSPDLDTQAGAFLFFDALPVAPVTLKCDVMTPHMGKWYEKGGDIADVNNQPESVPADWHDPVPIYFLVADRPRFQFAVAPRGNPVENELAKVFQALDDALQWLGAGAKTAVGYGQMAKEAGGADRPTHVATGPTQWRSVRLQYQKGSQEVSASGPGGERAFACGKKAQSLIEALDVAAKRSLERGKLVATIRVEHVGGNNWGIVAIEPAP